VRIKVEKRRVTEIEAVIVRREQRGAGGGTQTMMLAALPYQNNPADFAAVDPIFTTNLPKGKRATADGLSSAVQSYYEALRAADGSRAPLTQNCERRANGVRVTGVVDAAAPDPAHPSFRPLSLGCAAQLSTGYFREIETIREVGIWVADTERGLVLSRALFDIPNDRKTIAIKEFGDVALPKLSSGPYSILTAQLFRMDGDRIRRIEEQLRTVPYRMKSGWER
jgi:hypothetical protein